MVRSTKIRSGSRNCSLSLDRAASKNDVIRGDKAVISRYRQGGVVIVRWVTKGEQGEGQVLELTLELELKLTQDAKGLGPERLQACGRLRLKCRFGGHRVLGWKKQRIIGESTGRYGVGSWVMKEIYK